METPLLRNTTLYHLNLDIVKLTREEIYEELLSFAALLIQTPVETFGGNASLAYRFDHLDRDSIPEPQMILEVLP